MWKAAVEPRYHDGGASVRRLRKVWEAPGLAVVTPDTSSLTVVLFMRKETRARWRRPAASSGEFRSQQHAPPRPAPSDTIEIYTGGEADPRKKNMPPPPAGYGYAAYEKGIYWQLRFEGAGQIVAMSTPNVKTTTENLAELVAFTRALQWAAGYHMPIGRPIIIRYTSEYAARIATGAWKAKKHKAMAAEAQRAWAALKRSNGGRVWMLYTKRHEQAHKLAQSGKAGTTVYAEVNTVT